MCNDQHLLRMTVNDCKASSRQLTVRLCTSASVLMLASSIRRRLLQWLYTGSTSRQIIDDCICNGLMSKEPDKQIGIKLSLEMNHPSICRIMLAAVVLDAMLVNAAFLGA